MLNYYRPAEVRRLLGISKNTYGRRLKEIRAKHNGILPHLAPKPANGQAPKNATPT
jgi:hypothetical protein